MLLHRIKMSCAHTAVDLPVLLTPTMAAALLTSDGPPRQHCQCHFSGNCGNGFKLALKPAECFSHQLFVQAAPNTEATHWQPSAIPGESASES